MAESEFHKEHLGDLTTEEVEQIIEHLEFCDRLGQAVHLKTGRPETEAGELAERVKGLLHKGQRRQALADLEAGQCSTVTNREQCWLAAGHEGPHRSRREVG